jgi:hypothetical protein
MWSILIEKDGEIKRDEEWFFIDNLDEGIRERLL